MSSNRFMVRVLLHFATEADYQNLHAAMQRAGFRQTIFADDGREYHLPPAEYDFHASQSTEATVVREIVNRVAASTGRSHAVFVTEATGSFAWSGLEEVSSARYGT